MKKIKNKKALAIAGGVLGIAAIGGVIAFNQDLISFANLFNLKADTVEYIETFESPENWQPCQEVPKTVTVTNKNSYPVAVRIKFNEYWREANSQTSSDDHTTSDLALTYDDHGTTKPIAVINFTNPNDWTLESDGWYYYKEDLAANATTSVFLGSVTMDCNFSLVSNGTPTATATGMVGESVPNSYADATYHLYVTGQTIQADHKDEWRPAPHQADCDDPNNDLLYDHIACASNGTDENINFKTEATSVATGLGVNTYASSVNDQFATYYYHGDVANNNVIWANYCWKIVRTTETGGVKMIWMGTPSNGQCVDEDAGAGILGDDNYEYISGTSSYQGGFSQYGDLRSGGYMYSNIDAKYLVTSSWYDGTGIQGNQIDPSTTLYLANDVEWTGSGYNLVDYIQGVVSAKNTESMADHHYTCLNGTTSCEDVAYIWYYGPYDNSAKRYVLFGNGTTVETLADTVYGGNEVDSNAKIKIDNWFSNNIAAARQAELEDTIFCNDRSFGAGALTGKDVSGIDLSHTFGTSYSSGYFSTLVRQDAGTPSLICPSTRDSFTVSPSKGNGALTYPIGLLSSDEVGIAGGWAYKSYLHPYGSTWMGTYIADAAGIDREDGVKHYTIDGSYTYTSESNGFSPVVSLKFGAKFTGTGTAADPYVISF